MATEKIWSENQTELCNKLDVTSQAGVGFLLNKDAIKAATT